MAGSGVTGTSFSGAHFSQLVTIDNYDVVHEVDMGAVCMLVSENTI